MGSYTKRKLLRLDDHLFQDSSLLRRDENRKRYSSIPLKVPIFFKYKYDFYMYVNYILLDLLHISGRLLGRRYNTVSHNINLNSFAEVRGSSLLYL